MRLKLETEEYRAPRFGLIILQVAIVLLFLVLFARFWSLQVHRGAQFAQLAQDNRLRHERVFATRGEIYDRNGILLAENHIVFNISLVREDCPDVDVALAQISAWTKIPYEKILRRYEDNKHRGRIFEPIFLVTDLPFELIAPITAELHQWPGVDIVARPRRHYPQQNSFAHVLGYVAEAKTKELEKDSDLALGDIVGRQGLELVLEKTLRGQKAINRMEVDVYGRAMSRTTVRDTVSGNNVTLTLDAKLQQSIMALMGEHSGSVIVMNPYSGALHALVTKPAYDNNLFVTGFSQTEWDTLRNNPRYPFQNRTIQSIFPPASIWKLMMVGMFLENGVKPTETVKCTGRYHVGNRVFQCWRVGGHGRVDMERSIVESCDVYFFYYAEQLGIDVLETYARASGYGKITGIDLPHENAGLVPSRAWKQRKIKERWQTGDTVNTAIGQGYSLVTPIQTAVVVSALLNGGQLLKPQILMNTRPEVKGIIPIREEYRKLIVKYMVETVEGDRATARSLRRRDMQIGAKTGTAQVVKLRMIGNRRKKNHEVEYKERDHAWISAWGERDGETYVVVTMLEHGGGGASTAGPITRKVFSLLFPPEKSK